LLPQIPTRSPDMKMYIVATIRLWSEYSGGSTSYGDSFLKDSQGVRSGFCGGYAVVFGGSVSSLPIRLGSLVERREARFLDCLNMVFAVSALTASVSD